MKQTSVQEIKNLGQFWYNKSLNLLEISTFYLKKFDYKVLLLFVIASKVKSK